MRPFWAFGALRPSRPIAPIIEFALAEFIASYTSRTLTPCECNDSAKAS